MSEPKSQKIRDEDLKDLSKRMRDLYVAECLASKARLEVETECRRIIADSYEKMLAQAEEYSKKLEAPILAKVCEVGFFCDAHVIKTNHVTLEMGMGYFVECSVHTAAKIIARRAAQMRSTREDGLESIRLLNDKMRFCKENFQSVSMDGDIIEICETYDVGMERMFYENRKKRAQEKKEQNELGIVPIEEDAEHRKAMERLDELEEIEECQRLEEEYGFQFLAKNEEVPMPKPFEIPQDDVIELEEFEEESEDDIAQRNAINERLLAQPSVSRKELEALLQFLEDQERSSDEDEELEDEDEEKVEEDQEALDSDDYDSDEAGKKTEEEPVTRKRSSVRFAEELESVKTFLKTDMVEVKPDEDTLTIETKSILRNTEPTPVDHSALQKETEQKELAAMSTSMFPGEIIEKDPYECEPSTSKDPAPVITEGKVSKFRASRNRR